MQIIDNKTFLEQIAPAGLTLDTRHSEPRTLNFQNNLGISLPLPDNTRERAKAIFAALDLLADTPTYVYRRTGVWNFCQRQDRNVRDTLDRAVDSIFRLSGIADGLAATLLFQPTEADLLYALIYMNSVAAMSVADDLFLVPAHASFILYFDHDKQIILNCRDQSTHDRITNLFRATWDRLHLPTSF
jgi:hypothetical protein